MEINDHHPNVNKKGYLSRAGYSKGVNHCHLHFVRDSKTGRGVGKFYSRKKKVFKYALIAGCGHREAVGGISRRGTLYVISWGAYLAFSGWS